MQKGIEKMNLQKLNECYFYDKEQKNHLGYFYVIALDDNDELRRVEHLFYDEKKDEVFNFENLSVFIKVKFLVNEETYKMLRKSGFSYEEWENIYYEILKEIEAKK